MYIKYLDIESYGKFQNKEIAFGEGLNVVFGRNESGKTTMQSFMDDMLFGNDKEKVGVEDYTRYIPWSNPNKFSGNMIITLNDKNYYLKRNFLEKERSELATESDTNYHSGIDQIFRGKWDNSFTRSVFKNTAHIHQLSAKTEDSLAGKVSNYIANVSNSKNSEIDVANAKRYLKDRKRDYSAKIEGIKMDKYDDARKDAKSNDKRLEALAAEYKKLDEADEKLDKDYSGKNINKAKEVINSKEAVEQKYRQIGEIRAEIAEAKENLEKQRKDAVEEKSTAQSSKSSEELREMLEKLDKYDLAKEKLTKERALKEDKFRHRRGLAMFFMVAAMVYFGATTAITVLLVMQNTSRFLTDDVVTGVMNFWNDNMLFAILNITSVVFLITTIIIFAIRSSKLKRYKKEAEAQILRIKEESQKVLSGSGLGVNNKNALVELMQKSARAEVAVKSVEDKEKVYLEQISSKMTKLSELTCDVIEYGVSYGMPGKVNNEIDVKALKEFTSPINIEKALLESEGVLPDDDWMKKMNEKVALAQKKIEYYNQSYYAEKEKISNQKAVLRDKIDELYNSQNDIADLLKTEEKVLAKKKELELEVEAADKARSIIESLNVNIHGTIGEKLNKAITENTAKIMGAEKYQVELDDDMHLCIKTPYGLKPVDVLSHGAIDQIYLAARVAIADMFFDKEKFGESVPIIIDDGFITSDDERTSAALLYLSKLGRQVIIFTCMMREKMLLDRLGVEYTFQKLEDN